MTRTPSRDRVIVSLAGLAVLQLALLGARLGNEISGSSSWLDAGDRLPTWRIVASAPGPSWHGSWTTWGTTPPAFGSGWPCPCGTCATETSSCGGPGSSCTHSRAGSAPSWLSPPRGWPRWRATA